MELSFETFLSLSKVVFILERPQEENIWELILIILTCFLCFTFFERL